MKPSSCYGCALECHGSDFSAVEGLGTFGIMIVAEASGEREQQDRVSWLPGHPLVDKLGFKDAKLEVTEYIDTSFMDTFHHLLYADVLIGSKSGMSHLAGMLGEQIKVMPQMWHSYRGASKTLQLGSHITEAEISAVTEHLAQNLVT